MSCEHEEVLRTARAAVASQGSSPPAQTPTSYPYRRSLPWQHSQSYSVAAQYTLPLRQLPEQTGQLLRDDRCRDMGICIGGINDNRATVISLAQNCLIEREGVELLHACDQVLQSTACRFASVLGRIPCAFSWHIFDVVLPFICPRLDRSRLTACASASEQASDRDQC